MPLAFLLTLTRLLSLVMPTRKAAEGLRGLENHRVEGEVIMYLCTVNYLFIVSYIYCLPSLFLCVGVCTVPIKILHELIRR